MTKNKNILGLDLGTNSIGWAIVHTDEQGHYSSGIKIGSRIIPMTEDVLNHFDKGKSVSETAERTQLRGMRRLKERYRLRRERLHRVLHILGFLPKHYEQSIGWSANETSTYGKFIAKETSKLAWKNNEKGKPIFLFMDSFNEMLQDFVMHQPQLVENGKLIPLDWTIYYLRKKALTQSISKEELAWILLHFNQKRGYNQLRGEEKEEDLTKRIEYIKQKVVAVEATDEGKKGEIWYNVHLENGWIYRRSSKISLENWIGLTKEFIVTTEYEADGITVKKSKEGKEKRSFKAPTEDDWGLLKAKQKVS